MEVTDVWTALAGVIFHGNREKCRTFIDLSDVTLNVYTACKFFSYFNNCPRMTTPLFVASYSTTVTTIFYNVIWRKHSVQFGTLPFWLLFILPILLIFLLVLIFYIIMWLVLKHGRVEENCPVKEV